MRAFQVFAVLAAVVAAEHGSLRKPCDDACKVKRAKGKVAEAEEALDKNMKATAATQKMLDYTKSFKGSSDIAAQEKAVGDETQATALGKMLGSMWREMREYQSPGYEEHLTVEAVKLDNEHARLQVRLAKAHGELNYANAKAAATKPAPEEAEGEEDSEEEAPPAKLAISKPNGKSLKMHSKEDDDDDDDEDDDEQETPKVQNLKAVKVQHQDEAEDDAEAIADETEQEVDEAASKKPSKHKTWTNDGLAKGMQATSDQHAQFWKHGFSAGDPGRKGLYPADLSQPIPETPFTPKEIFGTKKVVEAPEKASEPAPKPAPKPAKVTTDPVPEEADDDDEEAEAVKRVEAANKEADEDDDGDDGDDEENEKAPVKVAAGEGDMGDGMSETHKQFKKFLSGGFSNGDARQGLYPVDLVKPAAGF